MDIGTSGQAVLGTRLASALLSVTQDVQSVTDGAEVARRGARTVTHVLGADTAIYFALDETRQHAVAVAGYRIPAELRQPAYRIPTEEVPQFVREASLRREPVASSLVTEDPRLESLILRMLPLQPRSMLWAPASRAGSVRGALVVFWWRDSREPTEDEMRAATAIATQVAVALDAGRAEAAGVALVAVVAPNKTLFIVARHNAHLYQSLLRTFAADDTVEIVLDRRIVQRRQASTPQPATRRRAERRRLPEVETQLRRRGWAVVTQKPRGR